MRQTDTSKEITPFNKTSLYKENIAPLIQELVKQCTIYNIPMYASFCVSNTANGTKYENHCVAPDSHSLNLTDDNIQKHLCIQLGFDVVYRSEDNFDFEDDASKLEVINI